MKATQSWAKEVPRLESLCSVKASGVGPKGGVFNGGGVCVCEVSKILAGSWRGSSHKSWDPSD